MDCWKISDKIFYKFHQTIHLFLREADNTPSFSFLYPVLSCRSCQIFSKAVFPILFSLIMGTTINSTARSQSISTFPIPYAISADSLKKHVEFLGSDALEGRATGSPGERLAAEYIAGCLERWKLKPAGDNQTCLQAIPMHGSVPLAESQLRLVSGGKVFDFVLGEDYLLYKTGAQTFIPNPVPLVFVGYGIIAPEFDYNDYQAVNVEGKIVVFLSGEPSSDDPAYFNGENPTIYSRPDSKQRLAISRGALGSILIPSLINEESSNWEKLRREFDFEDVQLAYSVAGNLSVLMNPAAADRLFENAGYGLQTVFEMHRQHNMNSFPLVVELSFKGEFLQWEFIAHNVIAMLEGKDSRLKDSYVIVSAHYDHLGVGPPINGDGIYNGVFDNAVGVAAALEIARVFAALPEPPDRSLIFLLVTGEEKGLLGSHYYLDNPVAPLYKTIANVNIDGLAMFDTFNDVVGIGADLSTLGDVLQQVAGQVGLETSPLPPEFLETESFNRSDQIAFAQAGIPSILILEGLDYQHTSREEGLKRMLEWNENVYHTPFDDLQQPMNFKAAEQHTRFLFAYCNALANIPTPPEWYPGVPYINIRLQTQAERR